MSLSMHERGFSVGRPKVHRPPRKKPKKNDDAVEETPGVA
jgi:hypothetical protein